MTSLRWPIRKAQTAPHSARVSPLPRCILLITLHSELSAAAVVMEIVLGPASSPDTVAMGTRVRNSLSAVEEDEGEELHLHRSKHRGNFSMLIVIGDIGTDHQLQIAKQHIERGEWRHLARHSAIFHSDFCVHEWCWAQTVLYHLHNVWWWKLHASQSTRQDTSSGFLHDCLIAWSLCSTRFFSEGSIWLFIKKKTLFECRSVWWPETPSGSCVDFGFADAALSRVFKVPTLRGRIWYMLHFCSKARIKKKKYIYITLSNDPVRNVNQVYELLFSPVMKYDTAVSFRLVCDAHCGDLARPDRALRHQFGCTPCIFFRLILELLLMLISSWRKMSVCRNVAYRICLASSQFILATWEQSAKSNIKMHVDKPILLHCDRSKQAFIIAYTDYSLIINIPALEILMVFYVIYCEVS